MVIGLEVPMMKRTGRGTLPMHRTGPVLSRAGARRYGSGLRIWGAGGQS